MSRTVSPWTASLSVWERMLAADTGEAARCSIKKTVSAGRGTSVDASANGNRLRASALACSFPALYRIV